MTEEMKVKVILFDIDGTLVHPGEAGRLGMAKAFYEVFGICYDFGGIIMAGNTDPGILQQAIQNHKLEGKADKIDCFKNRYFELLTENIKQDLPGGKVYPGVRKLLDELLRYKNVKLGLLTGNWKISAYTKLAHFGLDHYFDFGAFGDDSIFRDNLLPYALKRCNGFNNLMPRDAVIIGDTPSDIQCAQVQGARSIGVATGRYSIEELTQKGADWVIKDLKNTKKIISWIFDKSEGSIVSKMDTPSNSGQ